MSTRVVVNRLPPQIYSRFFFIRYIATCHGQSPGFVCLPVMNPVCFILLLPHDGSLIDFRRKRLVILWGVIGTGFLWEAEDPMESEFWNTFVDTCWDKSICDNVNNNRIWCLVNSIDDSTISAIINDKFLVDSKIFSYYIYYIWRWDNLLPKKLSYLYCFYNIFVQ